MAEWYYIENGQQAGPVNDAGLRQMAKSGTLSPDDLIWKDGLKDWVPARKAKGLFDSAAPAAKPAPKAAPKSIAPKTSAPKSSSPAKAEDDLGADDSQASSSAVSSRFLAEASEPQGEQLSEDTLFHSMVPPGQQQEDELAAHIPAMQEPEAITPEHQDESAEEELPPADQSSSTSRLADEALEGLQPDQSSSTTRMVEEALEGQQEEPAQLTEDDLDQVSSEGDAAFQENAADESDLPAEDQTPLMQSESGLGVPTPDFEAESAPADLSEESQPSEPEPAAASSQEFDPFADGALQGEQSHEPAALSEDDLMSGVEESPAEPAPVAKKAPVKGKKLVTAVKEQKASATRISATAEEYSDDNVPASKPSAALAVAGLLLGLFALLPTLFLMLFADPQLDPRSAAGEPAAIVVVESTTSDARAMCAMAISDLTGGNGLAGLLGDWRVMLGLGGGAVAVLLGLLAIIVGKLRKIGGLIAILLALGGVAGQYLFNNELVAKVNDDIDQATCAANLALIWQASENYRQANGQYPADIETMLKGVSYTRNNPRKCPAAKNADRKLDYFYLPVSGSPAEPMIIASDLPGNHADKFCALYSNGVVKWMSKSDFETELAKSVNAAYAAAMKTGRTTVVKSTSAPAESPAPRPIPVPDPTMSDAPGARVITSQPATKAQEVSPSPTSAPAPTEITPADLLQ